MLDAEQRSRLPIGTLKDRLRAPCDNEAARFRCTGQACDRPMVARGACPPRSQQALGPASAGRCDVTSGLAEGDDYLMSELEGAVPRHEPAEDVMALVARIGLAGIPVVGPMAVETLAHAIESRQATRQHEFNLLLARKLSAAFERLDGIQRFVSSDELVAEVTRAQRAAAESASDRKRVRLAQALANTMRPDVSAADRRAFMRLVEAYEDLHIVILEYFADPRAMLASHGLWELYATVDVTNIEEPLSAILQQAPGTAAVRDAIEDLQRDMLLGSFDPHEIVGEKRAYNSRVSGRGRRFLAMLAGDGGTELDAD